MAGLAYPEQVGWILTTMEQVSQLSLNRATRRILATHSDELRQVGRVPIEQSRANFSSKVGILRRVSHSRAMRHRVRPDVRRFAELRAGRCTHCAPVYTADAACRLFDASCAANTSGVSKPIKRQMATTKVGTTHRFHPKNAASV
jgi:hypothetical protein